MFAENESESPRVPSPWDPFISTPPSPSPSPVPRLVPEQDDGNVEYKLQLLSPSPGRFARLVTQMKWRLLEGGGQAYYELGVADSGMLVGLPRAELEQSLETLEMMAGEIGASVIVVKEIEVPAAMLDLVSADPDSWYGKRTARRQPLLLTSDESTATNTETELSATDVDDELSTSVKNGVESIFSMDDLDDMDSALVPQGHFDLEIASVYKPRPVRERSQGHQNLHHKKKGAKGKKGKHLPDGLLSSAAHESDGVKAIKAQKRRQNRDRKREERLNTLVQEVSEAVEAAQVEEKGCSQTDALVTDLEALHVSVNPEPSSIPALELPVDDPDLDLDGEDDVFPSMVTAVPGPFTGLASTHLTVPVTPLTSTNASNVEPRLIVEALVVRKMSIEEAFLDFGGAFSLT
ncbi:GTP-binding protein 2 [Mycena indigotica]|uniref:GTP-binding protein 2 n=1 Tax=Mycena indigotica TaxID=2126181 RepID=A0A8H6SGA8_9AGAR|nr:GTP-binding protein 2 [Mycena indigotica]KAF7297310.1 GTP-binding protein 2 [Mycena indigotica]